MFDRCLNSCVRLKQWCRCSGETKSSATFIQPFRFCTYTRRDNAAQSLTAEVPVTSAIEKIFGGDDVHLGGGIFVGDDDGGSGAIADEDEQVVVVVLL